MKTKKMTLTKQQAERINEILSRPDFRYTYCSAKTRIKIIRFQILFEPIAQTVKDTVRSAQEKLMTDELKNLLDKVQRKEIKNEEVQQFNELYREFENNFVDMVKPILESPAGVVMDKLTMDEYNEMMDSNKEWISGDLPRFLLEAITDESKTENPSAEAI